MRWIGRILGWAVIAAIVALAAAFWFGRPGEPGSFYAWDAPVEAAPGTLLRDKPLDTAPVGMNGHRILYATTRADGTPAVASGVVYVPGRGGAAPLLAWAHGTTGVQPGCAPSLGDPLDGLPANPALFGEGWSVVVPDYTGLGAGTGHGYLVGAEAGHAVLDAIRAAGQLDGVTLEPGPLVWGHSQGGHAALWAGQLAPDYAPELTLAGVAAIAPASDLPRLVLAAQDNLFGRIVSAYLVAGYDAAYPDLDPWDYLGGIGHRLAARDIAGRCVGLPDAAVSAAWSALLRDGLFTRDPTEGPLGARLSENVPAGPFAMPVLVAQGGADDLVLPDVQQAFVAGLCEAGEAVAYRGYPDEDHLSVVAPGSALNRDLLAWSQARRAGTPAPGCDG